MTSNGNMSKNRDNLIIWALEEEVKIKAYKAHGTSTLDSFEFSNDNLNLAVSLGN